MIMPPDACGQIRARLWIPRNTGNNNAILSPSCLMQSLDGGELKLVDSKISVFPTFLRYDE